MPATAAAPSETATSANGDETMTRGSSPDAATTSTRTSNTPIQAHSRHGTATGGTARRLRRATTNTAAATATSVHQGATPSQGAAAPASAAARRAAAGSLSSAESGPPRARVLSERAAE